MKEVIKLDTVDQYNRLFGLETLHPLVSVVNLSEATRFPTHFTMNYGIYALFLKNVKCGDIRQMCIRDRLWPADLRLSGRNGHQLCPGTGG